MGLSEREQQLLDDMERRFYQSEADVVNATPSQAKLNLRSLVLGILVVIAGLALLIAGVSMQQLWLGLLAFVVMVAGTLLAFTKRETTLDSGSRSAGAGTSKPKSSGDSLNDRLSKRWEQRMDGER